MMTLVYWTWKKTEMLRKRIDLWSVRWEIKRTKRQLDWVQANKESEAKSKALDSLLDLLNSQRKLESVMIENMEITAIARERKRAS